MEELVTCEGTVHSVIFQNAENGYTVLRLLTEEGEVVTVVGLHPLRGAGRAPGGLRRAGRPTPSTGSSSGRWSWSGACRRTRRRSSATSPPASARGVGPATARRIVERFGAETLDILEREPERLTTLEGRHRPQGPGDRGELPPAHGPAAADGLSGPATSCLLSWPWSCGRQYGDAALENGAGESLPPLLARRAAWTSPSPTRSPWAWASGRRQRPAAPGGGDSLS